MWSNQREAPDSPSGSSHARDVVERGVGLDALRASEARFRSFFDHALDGFFLLDDHLKVLDVNRQACESLGYGREELIGMHPRDFDAGLDESAIEGLKQRILGGDTTFETQHRRKDGTLFPVEIRARRIEEGGHFFLCLVRDITERRRAEEERTAHLWLLEAMDRVNRAMEGTKDIEKMIRDVLEVVLGIFACDRAWLHDCGPVPPSARVLVEITRPEYPGPEALGIHEPLPAEIIAHMQALRRHGAAITCGPGGEAPLPPRVAEQWQIQSQILLVIEPKADHPFVLGLHQCSYARVWTSQEKRLFQEIGRRLGDALTSRLMLRSLRESERRLDEAQHIAHVGYWDRELETGQVTLSDEACRIFGLRADERTLDLPRWHEQWLGLIHPDDRPRVAEATKAALEGGSAYDVEYRVIRPSGDVRIVHSRGMVQRDESSRPERMFGMMQDITDLRQVEDELRASEARFRAFADNVTDALLVHDEQGTILDANREACDRLGYTREELIGMHPLDFDSGQASPPTASTKARLEAGETVTFESEVRRKDGSLCPVEYRVSPYRRGGSWFALSSARDITERKRAEQRLLAHHSVTRILAEASTFEDATPKILQALSECLRWEVSVLWRHDREAGVLRCAELWRSPSIATTQFEAATRELTFGPGSGIPGRVWTSRSPLYIPDVSLVPALPRAGCAASEGLHSALAFPIMLGNEVLGVFEFFGRDIPQPDQELLDIVATIGSQIGQFIERKRAESALQLAQTELAHVARLTTLGELTASIAHEVNQPLGAMVASAAACARWLGADPPEMGKARRALERIVNDGKRASAVIERIRALIKRQAPRNESLDINQAIREVIALAQPELRRHDIALERLLTEDLPAVQGDKVQLQQVLLNLIVNAIEAMSGVTDRRRRLSIVSAMDGPEALCVEVHDCGTGLDPQSAARLFEPFFTTKAQGIGIGLSISHSIVEAHGGSLTAAARVPYGAVFRFSLPCEQSGAISAAAHD